IDMFCQLFPERWNDESFRASFDKNVTYELGRVKHLLDELLEIARPVKLDFKEVHLTGVVERAAQGFKNGNHADLKLTFESQGVSEKILADEFALLRVFQNLIQNAAQAMKNNGQITIGWKKGRNGMELYFKDTGPGMEEEVLSRIFEPFFSNKQGGTGLGLAICRKIIQGHGGTIHAESQIGKGTTFFLKLPQNPAEALS
ncbi:MAG: ATP-binding protein, partial [bacterium]|nr:ATP-binding protein [bacterium]